MMSHLSRLLRRRPLARRALLLPLLLLVLAVPGRAADPAPPAWQPVFERVCAGTSEAMSLSLAELEALVAECATLAQEVAQLDESRARAYGKRLSLACNLYRFVLDEKRAAEAP